ncbi:MAG TPA: hypothetical protein PK323_04565 [Bacteroidia bacterium]|nr:hypothetical protein [Bacteroidia bacterium]
MMKKIILFSFIIAIFSCSKQSANLSNENTKGKNGSLTRFAIKDNFMYAIDLNYLKVYDISNQDEPILRNKIKVDYGIETISIYGNYVYLGAVDGVYIIDIKNPSSPVELEKIEHHVSCDPVIVLHNRAYSTQRTNAIGCGNIWTQSVLAVYDVVDPQKPTLINSISMEQPYGLAGENNWLFVCDEGKNGVVIFDISDPSNPVEKGLIEMEQPRDIILTYPYMIISSKTSFKIFNYSNVLQTTYVSTFELN